MSSESSFESEPPQRNIVLDLTEDEKKELESTEKFPYVLITSANTCAEIKHGYMSKTEMYKIIIERCVCNMIYEDWIVYRQGVLKAFDMICVEEFNMYYIPSLTEPPFTLNLELIKKITVNEVMNTFPAAVEGEQLRL
jgi:hypothetical protein